MVLDKLAAKNVPWAERTARFRCVITLATRAGIVGTVQGSVEGFIDYEAKGQNGFGYDPVFFVPEFDKTLAQISSTQKHRISHRGRATRAVIPLIQQLIYSSRKS